MRPVLWFGLWLAVATPASADNASLPFEFERFSLPGPVAGVLIRLDLRSPRVQVKVALADERDPDGAGPAVGLLDTTSNVARKRDFAVTLNASFFKTPESKVVGGSTIRYFVGNGAYPAGWHYSNGKLVSAPARTGLRSTMVIHQDGKVSLLDNLQQLPSDTRYAVSGNAMMLTAGKVSAPFNDFLRHPRSAIGISADGKTLFMMVVDGRQDGYSRGVTLSELAEIFLSFGAWQAINLDGGGSSAMVLKDPAIGTYSLVNRPSDQSSLKPPLAIERPVVDVVGIVISP